MPNRKVQLPPGILPKDTQWQSSLSRDQRLWSEGDHGQLTFYKISGHLHGDFWVIETLLIARAGRRAAAGATDRTYAITLDGRVMRVGLGPHVRAKVTVYLHQSRRAALQQYIDLHAKGIGDAMRIRDRISSRRAQGQLERMAGNRSWIWKV